MMRLRRAFTLIELLTVMAISAILLGLIVLPLFQSFNLTRAAQAFSDAQDRARVLTDRIAREVGNAAMVRGGNGYVLTSVNGATRQVNASSLVYYLPNSAGAIRATVVPYSKLDLIPPAEGDQSQIGSGAGYRDPVTGNIDPTLNHPKGQVVLPVAPGYTLVRYFVGRRDPFQEYNNPYDGILMARNGNRDNLYVLYRAEVQPFVLRAGQGSNGDTSTRWRPNLTYFQSDQATDMNIVYTLPNGTEIEGMDDPAFFEPTRNATLQIVDDRSTANSKGSRVANWLARSVVQTEVSRYDMVLPVYNKATHVPEYDPTTGAPRLIPLVQFRPERMNNDPATGSTAIRQGDESDISAAFAPDVFATQYGLWGGAVVRTFPQGWAPQDNAGILNRYEVGLVPSNNAKVGYSVYAYLPASGPVDYDPANLVELFDVDQYDRLSSLKGVGAQPDRIYPFSSAVGLANNRSSWIDNASLRTLFTPYDIDIKRGRVLASFDLKEVGDPTQTPSDPDNLPAVLTSPNAASVYGAINHPQPMTGVFSDAPYSSINEKFAKIWSDYPALQPNLVHRFVDLRALAQSDGTPSPLYPKHLAGTATGFTYDTADGGNRNKVQIVPGSDVVVGPDQLPGPNQGQLIRYTRITRGDPGPNQYKINYADFQEPVNGSNQIDYTVAFPGISTAGFDPRNYDPTNFVSAVLQPRYKVGYVQFNSDPAVPIPYGPIRISYRFQFTGTRTGLAVTAGQNKSDQFAVDYDTRQLLSVLLTIRNYPQSSIPNPQTVTLKSTATVRNYTR